MVFRNVNLHPYNKETVSAETMFIDENQLMMAGGFKMLAVCNLTVGMHNRLL